MGNAMLLGNIVGVTTGRESDHNRCFIEYPLRGLTTGEVNDW